MKAIGLWVGMMCLAGAQVEWKEWNRASAEVQLSDGQFAKDGRLRILFVEDVTFAETERLLKLATFRNGSFTVETIEEIGVPGESITEIPIRLIGDGERVWAVWRRKTGNVASATIRAAQVYPRSGPLVIETVDGGTAFDRIDACLGDDGFPRVAITQLRETEVAVIRRTASGVWEKKALALPSPGDEEYQEVAITSDGPNLSVFTLAKEELSSGANPFLSKLRHHVAVEPVNWQLLSFGSPEIVDQAATSDGLEVAANLEAGVAEGEPVIAYQNFSEGSGVLALRSGAGVWTPREYASRDFGLLRGVDLSVAPDGSIHLLWQANLQQIRYVVWSDGAFHPDEPVGDLKRDFVDLEVDERGIPWVISPSLDQSELSVITPLDYTDEDGDGVIYLVEDALRLNPLVADAEDLPGFELTTVGGQQYLALTYLAWSGGSGNNPYVTTNYEYYVESSDDMANWSSASADVVLKDRFSIPGRGTVNTLRSTKPFASESKEFLRIRVVRR